jgi:tRNA-Thr(GGU) m(6)t(6)A37 methyltransferase TsaA
MTQPDGQNDPARPISTGQEDRTVAGPVPRDDDRDALRPGEMRGPAPGGGDGGLSFIGWIETPWATRGACPRQGDPEAGPVCRVHVAEAYRPALLGLEDFARIELLYWLHGARRDLLQQSPLGDGAVRGTFALRSPLRPNPIGTSRVALVGITAGVLEVRGLDCLDGTPLVDIKPDRCAYTPLAAPRP